MALKSKKRFLRIVIILFLSAVLLLVAGLSMLFSGRWGNIPTKEELKDVRNYLASEVYSDNNELLGKYFFENRSNASFDEIPTFIIQALVATEDARFFEHGGIDRRSVIRVLVKSILMGDRSSGGGSTISQQLIKNLYPRIGDSFLSLSFSKVKEMIAARRLEDIYSKDEILTLYLNTVPFGDNTFGIKSAADHYFSKDLKDLTVEEAAVLIGMLKGTNLYNPYYHPENALPRRNIVLNQMVKYNYLEENVADSLKEIPLEINYKLLSHHSGLAPYFREYLRQDLQKWCATHFKENGDPYDLYRDGLKIYTTIDAGLQRDAEDAMKYHMSRLQSDFDNHWKNSKPWNKHPEIIRNAIENSDRFKRMVKQNKTRTEIDSAFNAPVKRKMFSWNGEKDMTITPLDSIKYSLQFLHTGLLALQPDSGYVKAWVGGINHKYYQYDHVLSRRQVGSTFKPFVYTTGLEYGIEPDDFFKNDSIVYTDYDNWTPSNSDNKYGGEYSVLGALVNSVNTVTVQVAMKCGLENVKQTAYDLGIKTSLPDVPSIALGTAEIPLIEMVPAYAAFVNGGYRVEPYYLTRIEDRNGKVLEEFRPVKPVKVLDEDVALTMAYMLKMVVDSGTARSIRSTYGIRMDMGGKTGTTQQNADGWFIGLTPDLITGIWVGAENPAIHFRTITYGQGAYMALPIFANMVKNTQADGEYTRYFDSSFKMMNNRMARQFDVAMYRDHAEPADRIEQLIDIVGDIFAGNKKHVKSDSTKVKEESFLEKLGNLFRKKKNR
ncbi:transglycosylase domain-containing protein [Saccharicrinis sp. FJH62]|uniref:transglycosylase domain-containing protein n=1 Tax=Saccharicrinis sp. FJH62 TaxID=3344657 RepID=UPI0035D3F6F6